MVMPSNWMKGFLTCVRETFLQEMRMEGPAMLLSI